MAILIDGYNLLHAIGFLHGRVGPQGLEKARLRLLGLLRGTYGEKSAGVTVVFDAAGALAGSEEANTSGGIQIRYAVHHQQADDLIEELIQHDSAPRHLEVVSDDHRIQQAAHRRQCIVTACLDYLDELGRLRRQQHRRHEEQAEKTEVRSDEEVQRWLKEFGGLEDDPAMKELFDSFGLDDESARSP